MSFPHSREYVGSYHVLVERVGAFVGNYLVVCMKVLHHLSQTHHAALLTLTATYILATTLTVQSVAAFLINSVAAFPDNSVATFLPSKQCCWLYWGDKSISKQYYTNFLFHQTKLRSNFFYVLKQKITIIIYYSTFDHLSSIFFFINTRLGQWKSLASNIHFIAVITLFDVILIMSKGTFHPSQDECPETYKICNLN